MVTIQCPNCGRYTRIDDALLGRKGRCKKCSHIYRAQALAVATAVPAAPAAVDSLGGDALADDATRTLPSAAESMTPVLADEPLLSPDEPLLTADPDEPTPRSDELLLPEETSLGVDELFPAEGSRLAPRDDAALDPFALEWEASSPPDSETPSSASEAGLRSDLDDAIALVPEIAPPDERVDAQEAAPTALDALASQEELALDLLSDEPTLEADEPVLIADEPERIIEEVAITEDEPAWIADAAPSDAEEVMLVPDEPELITEESPFPIDDSILRSNEPTLEPESVPLAPDEPHLSAAVSDSADDDLATTSPSVADPIEPEVPAFIDLVDIESGSGEDPVALESRPATDDTFSLVEEQASDGLDVDAIEPAPSLEEWAERQDEMQASENSDKEAEEPLGFQVADVDPAAIVPECSETTPDAPSADEEDILSWLDNAPDSTPAASDDALNWADTSSSGADDGFSDEWLK